MTRSRPRRERILYFIGGLRIGGMEIHLLHLLAGLDRSRFEPVVCCLHPDPGYLERLKELGVPVYNLRVPTFTSAGNCLRLGRLLAVLARHRPGVVVTYGFGCDLVGPLAARLFPGTRVITTRRGEDRSPNHQHWRSRMNRFTDCVACVSEATARFTRETEELHRARLRVISNGVVMPEEAYAGTPAGSRLRFGTLGTVKPIKGTDILVDAFLRFDRADPCELHIAGQTDVGDWGAALMARAGRSHLADRIHFHGFEAEPRRFFPKIDVFVLPSRSEGMSMALLEAMACGLPCIATDVGSNREVLTPAGEERPGGLVTPAEPEALFAAMRLALQDAPRRRAWGEAGRALARRNHSMRAMVDRWEALYLEMLGRADRPAEKSAAEAARETERPIAHS